MANMNSTIADIKSLRGTTVSIFGQQTKLNEEVSPYLVDTIEVLENLKSYEVTEMMISEYDEENDEYIEVATNDIDTYLEYLEELGLKEGKHDNSYNWNGNLSHEIDFRCYSMDNEEYMVLKVHRYGDVRCNYTDEVLLKFDDDYQFVSILNDSAICESVTIDNKNYSLYISPLNENIEVSVEDGENGYTECGSLYGYYDNEEDVIRDIKEDILEIAQ